MENLAFTFAVLKNVRTFVVLQIFIINGMGVFILIRGIVYLNIEKLYPCFIGLMSIKVCSKMGYGFSFFISDNFISCYRQMKVI